MLEKLSCYLLRVSVFLVTVALIAGMAGCDGTSKYSLTVAVAPSGGGMATDLTNASPYAAGTVVTIKAEANEGYLFSKWEATAGTFANANFAETTFTMPAQDVIVTADFVSPLISTWYDLDAIRNNLSGTYSLINDLDSTTPGYEELASPTANGGKGWEPIGGENYQFTGTFDGQGYEIRDLLINRHGEDYVGLFGVVDEEGVIEDIGVMNVTVIGHYNVGGLVGRNYGTVNNSYSTGNVNGTWSVGGLMGANHHAGTVSSSYSTASVTATSWPDASGVGGLVGTNSYSGAVINSYSTGSIIGDRYVGGLVGVNSWDGTVSDSYSTGNVTGDMNVGGLVGHTSDGNTVSNSYYNYDEVLINGENIINIGALFSEDFEQWLANDKFLDVNEKLSGENGYYLINDVSDFKQLLAFGQNGTLKFRLTNDLDLGDEPNFYIPCLAGEFDGNGHKISNLSFNFDFISDVGLFGYLAPGGNVTDLAAENVNITGDESVGGLVGWNIEGTVSNSSSTGSVTGEGSVGGLLGKNWGTVSDSYFTGTVTGESSVGGLVGHNYGPLSNSYSSGSVSGISGSAGGLVGANGDVGTVSNSYSTASVTSDNNVGGLVGMNAGTVSNSYSTGSVTGSSNVGGLVGVNGYGGTVSNSFWDTQTSGQATSDGGTGKTTAQMKNIATFSGAGWYIITVANADTRNPSYIWNIVDDVTYPFLSWQPV